MLFLLNDVVLRLEGAAVLGRPAGGRLGRLSLPAIICMGQELYAEEPLLHLRRPARARRLGALISGKVPMINAAFFLATGAGCSPSDVTVRFAAVQSRLMEDLEALQRAGGLDILSADRLLWRRLAA
jgi:hypothetical protein